MWRPHAVVACMSVVGVLAGAGCAASGDTPASPAATEQPTTTGGGSSVAEAITPLPPAGPLPAVADLAPPAMLAVPALGVSDAPVAAVGVRQDGDMDVPGVREVGWYRFGPRPGDAGSAVLAAHVAYDGVDGVFRHLDDLAAGDAVTVAFADGSSRSFTVTEVAQVPKADLPDAVWARDGEPQLVLITCGGEFDNASDHYEDNVVAYARPSG
jgi:LPXTG-site transpeptidase (sortase) family protein